MRKLASRVYIETGHFLIHGLFFSFRHCMLHATPRCGFKRNDEMTEAMLSEPVYEGETWVEMDSPLRIVCKIPMQEPYALHWTINNEPLDSTLVTN